MRGKDYSIIILRLIAISILWWALGSSTIKEYWPESPNFAEQEKYHSKSPSNLAYLKEQREVDMQMAANALSYNGSTGRFLTFCIILFLVWSFETVFYKNTARREFAIAHVLMSLVGVLWLGYFVQGVVVPTTLNGLGLKNIEHLGYWSWVWAWSWIVFKTTIGMTILYCVFYVVWLFPLATFAGGKMAKGHDFMGPSMGPKI